MINFFFLFISSKSVGFNRDDVNICIEIYFHNKNSILIDIIIGSNRVKYFLNK
jgi:hypothetical protein